MNTDPKVSVIVTARNYAKYLPQCLDSVISQHFQEWELIVVNDGSTDQTPEILDRYQKQYPENVTVITLEGVGLARACNIGIKASKGEYIIRLDADDYFDENILLVESNVLDNNPDIHMVYPDYYRITKHGEIMECCRLSKVNHEIKLLDRSPLAAGAMFRRSCYEALGGYSEELRYQEDYDFWIRFVDKFNVYNVNLPLMYYRIHGANMSDNFEGRIRARQYVKAKFVEQKGYRKGKHIIGVIPAMGLFRDREKLALKLLCGKPLIAYTIEEALKTDFLNRVIVSTEDREIATVATQYGAEIPFLRPVELAKTSVCVTEVLRHMIGVFRSREELVPDIITVLPYLSPFRKERHITEGIDTLLAYDTDSVIGVVKDLTFHWKPGEYGLTPVGYQKRLLREDKETIYKENASLYVIKTSNLDNGEYLGKSVGHIEMSPEGSWRIESDFDFWVAEKMMQGKTY